MGLKLNVKRRDAAIGYWRGRIEHLVSGNGVTQRSLAAALGPNLPDTLANVGSPLIGARETLSTSLKLREPERSVAVDAWICRHLIDKGPRLIVTEAKRSAVLAKARDADRRTAEKQQPVRMRTIKIPGNVAARFRAYKDATKSKSDGDALNALLKQAHGSAPSEKNLKPDSPDLFRTAG